MHMYSTEAKLDRDIARSFLHTPTNTISYRPMHMRNEQNHRMIIPSPSIDCKENPVEHFLPPPHPNAQFPYSNLIPMYYDMIIDTVTDYDMKQTERYYHSNSKNDQELLSTDHSIYPRHHVRRLDEHAVSMDFSHDYDSISHYSNGPMESSSIEYEQIQPIKSVRFNDTPTWIRSSKKNALIPMDQYYFHPETITPIDEQASSVRYITTPFFWFRPVIDHNYAICIPTSRHSLHAYITPAFDPPVPTQFTPNPIRL